jgi:predicted ribosomally synthesized peptide with SipW-like signal peptide
MSRKHVKQYLMLLLAVGVIAVSLSGGGTFASFNAQVANAGNTFVTGTLFLHETKTNTCTSESSSTNANLLNGSGVNIGDQCDVLFTGTPGNQLVGLTMKNAGSLNGAGLQLAFGDGATDGFTYNGCVSSATYTNIDTLGTGLTSGNAVTTIHLASPLTISLYNGAQIRLNDGTHTQIFTTNAIASVGAVNVSVVSQNANFSYTTSSPTTNIQYSPQFGGGGGNLCSSLKLEIIEVPNAGALTGVTVNSTTGNTSAPAGSICVLGGATNGSNGCNFSTASTLTSLASSDTYPTFGTLSLNNLSGSTDPVTGTGLDAGTSRYIVLALVLDPNAGNSVQGLQAAFDLAWNMNQA